MKPLRGSLVIVYCEVTLPLFTLQYVYDPSDFDTTGDNQAVPNEAGAIAQGTPDFNLQLNTGAGPQQIVIDDNDSNFEEIGDTGQLLDQAVTINGVTYPAGSTVILNYVLTTDDGFAGYSITIGAGNGGSNTTTAFVTNDPMVPGQQYVFTSETNIGNTDIPYDTFVCFTSGTSIRTPNGEQLIDTLMPGDLVCTLEHGARPIRWIGKRTVPAVGKATPILFEAGTLATSRDLLVSPNHRMLVTGAMPQLMLGMDETLVAAKALVNDRNVRRHSCGFVTYIHVMFDQHELIWANDCLSESFYLAKQSMECLDNAQAAEIAELFPEFLPDHEKTPTMAKAEARGFEGRLFAPFM